MDGDTPMMQKLYDAVQCVKDGTVPCADRRPACPICSAVRMAQALPVRDIDPDPRDWLEEEGRLIPLRAGTGKRFWRLCSKWALPGEIGISL